MYKLKEMCLSHLTASLKLFSIHEYFYAFTNIPSFVCDAIYFETI